jgi:hypothetical protein
MNTKKERSIVEVMVQVEAALKTNGPLEIVTRTLDNFEHEITSEQASHDELIERSRVECASEFDFRRREVADATAALREGQATLEGAQDQLRRASSDLKFVSGSLVDYREYIENLSERRVREANEFAQEQSTYELDVAAVSEAVELLEGIFSGEEEFVQLAKHSHKLFKAAMRSGKPDTYADTFAALASLSSRQADADVEILERVRNVLSNLHESIESNWVERVATEEDLIARGEHAHTAATEVYQSLLDEESRLTIEVADLNKVIVTETGVVASATAKRDRNQRLWDDAVDLCQLQEEEYEHSTAGRRQERDLIDNIRSKVHARYGGPN